MGADAAPRGGTRRVLVVDDDARVRSALRALIDSSAGLCAWGEASSGPDALRADAALGPDVVLLDLMLPSSDDGLEALAALVARGRAVVALSIRATLGPAALATGAAAFVEKGADPDLLVGALRAADGFSPARAPKP